MANATDRIKAVLDEASTAEIDALFNGLAREIVRVSEDLSPHFVDSWDGTDTTVRVFSELLQLLYEYKCRADKCVFTDATGRLGQLVDCKVIDHSETDDTETLIFYDSKTGKHRTLMINDEGIYLSE